MNLKRLARIFLISVPALLALGCVAPVLNVSDAPVVANKPVTVEDVGRAIVRAGVQLGWQMKINRPGDITGTLALRSHLAVVDISYNAKAYSITYKDSQNLKYDGTNIHTNYNGWIQNLDNHIKAQLGLL